MSQHNPQHSEDLQHIRTMMERSSRFISLSGISGILAGVIALIAGFIAKNIMDGCVSIQEMDYEKVDDCAPLSIKLLALAFITMVLAISSGAYFTIKKSKKNNLPIWTSTTRKLLFNFSVPLLTGFFVCCALYYHDLSMLILPATLIFYGLGLFNAGNFTFGDIRILGICEIILGIIGFFFYAYGLDLWMFGFGILHILYGFLMYRKYQ